MPTNVVGRLRTDLICNTAQYAAGMRGASAVTRQFSAQAKQTGAVVSSLNKVMSIGIFGGLTGVGAAYGMVRLIRTNEEFQKSLQSSIAIMGDVSESMRSDLYEASRNVARQTKFSAKEAADSIYYLVSAGLDAKQAMSALPVVAKFGQAGMFDMATATDMLVKSQDALGLSSKDATVNMENMKRIADVVTLANIKSTASVEQFAEALQQRGAMAGRYGGMGLEETTAFLMAFAKGGFALGADAGEMLWRVMRDLRTKAIENEKAFKSLGITVYDVTTGQIRTGIEIMKDLDKALGNLSDKAKTSRLKELGFTDRALAPIMHLLGKSGDIEQWTEAAKDAGNVMEDVANKQLTDFSKACRDAKSAVGDLWDALKAPQIISGVSRGFSAAIKGARGLTTFSRMAALNEIENLYRGSARWKQDFGGDPSKDLTMIEELQRARHQLMVEASKPYMEEAFARNPLAQLPARLKNKATALSAAEVAKLNIDIEAENAAKALGDDLAKVIKDMQLDIALNELGAVSSRVRKIYKQFGGLAGSAGADKAELGKAMRLADKLDEMEFRAKQPNQAVEWLTKYMDKMNDSAKRGRAAFESSLNPFERFLSKVADYQELLDVGAITQDTFNRAKAAADKDMMSTFKLDKGYTPVAAMEAGSADAYSAINRALYGGGLDRDAQSTRLKQLEEMKKTSRTLDEIKKGMAEVEDIK